jgi:hypothetical protein
MRLEGQQILVVAKCSARFCMRAAIDSRSALARNRLRCESPGPFTLCPLLSRCPQEASLEPDRRNGRDFDGS